LTRLAKNLTVSQRDNLWRHWWAGHMRVAGAESRLPLGPIDASYFPPAKPRRTPTNWQTPEMADWAKRLLGDRRITDITLEDVLDGLDDYFELFVKLKRIGGSTYKYYSTVGTPMALRHTQIYVRDLERHIIPNPERLPSQFGAFVARTKDEYRDQFIKDEPAMMDFECYEKLTKNYVTAAPHGTTIYQQNMIALGRNAFTKAELKKYPAARGQWGVSWLVGVLPDGSVKALPCQMSRVQTLPNGGRVHHSGLQIPPGLYNWRDDGGETDPHDVVKKSFLTILAFTASSLAGVQVTIKKAGSSVRIGLPITNLRGFFGDRDASGARRKPILHLARPHLRRLAGGKEIIVGEHLRGERFFRWREYEITVGAPGIHHSSVEAFSEPLVTEEDRNFADLDKSKFMDSGKAGELMGREIWSPRRVRIRRGQPVRKFHENPLHKALDNPVTPARK
jgi:hypothetical protein